MLFLPFQIGEKAYALAASGVIEVLPLVELSTTRDAPADVAGVFDYRGRFVPVVDLCVLELRRPAHRRLGTRMIMVAVTHPTDAAESTPVGLIAENVTEIMRCEPGDFMPFVQGPRGLTERAEPDALIPAALRGYLVHARHHAP